MLCGPQDECILMQIQQPWFCLAVSLPSMMLAPLTSYWGGRKMITLYVQLILPLLWSVSNKLQFSWARLDGVLSCCVLLDPVQISDCWIVTPIIIIIYVISSQYELLQMVTFSITEQSSLFVQSTCSWIKQKATCKSLCVHHTL